MQQIYYYRANLTVWFMALVLSTVMSGCSSFIPVAGVVPELTTNGSGNATVTPTVSNIFPANNSTDVAINSKPTVIFSELMDAATINNTTYTLNQGTTPVAGTVSYSGSTAMFTPTSNFVANTLYTVTVTTGAKNLAGKGLASNYTWSFTTGSASDTSLPTVNSTLPTSGATSIAINSKPTVIFSELMDPLTITNTTYTLNQGNTPVAGVVTYAGNTATFTSNANLLANTLYTATITTGAKDLAGNSLASNYTWSFTTGSALDTSLPTVISTLPTNAATGVAFSVKPTVTFSEVMDPLTITNTTYTLSQGNTPIQGTVAYDGNTATFTPNFILSSNTLYTATITTSAKDLAGNSLASNYVWTFTTPIIYSSGSSNGGGSNGSNSGGYYPNPFTNPTVTSVSPNIGANNVVLNVKPTATFSEAMNPSSINNTTFTLKQGANNVIGTVTYVGNTATFTPTLNLSPNTTYTATITTGAKDLDGNGLVNNYSWNFITGIDNIAPTVAVGVNSTQPINNETNVALDIEPKVTFSEAMNPTTINNTTYTLTQVINQVTTPVAGIVTYDAITRTATFTPTIDLSPNTIYTATITTGAQDLAGNSLANNYSWVFTTIVDNTTPTVVSTLPTNNAINVALNTKPTVTFSEAMDAATINNTTYTLARVTGPTTTVPVTGTVSYIGNTATFTPDINLVSGTYTATITSGALGVKDRAGNALASNYSWSFTTGSVLDQLNPTVISNFPIDNATQVPVIKNMTATFSEAMNPLTITDQTFTLRQGLTQILGIVSYNSQTNTATFNPSGNLLSDTEYTATVTTGAEDIAGNGLATNRVWTFRTGQAPVFLGSTLSNFVVLAGSTVTNANATTVNGDLGVSPGTAVTGFPPGILNGSLEAGNPTAAAAKAELGNAFLDATLRAGSPILKAGNLGGQTLEPGLYKSTSSLEISSGNLTLDAKGDADSVFIFQMATTFNMTVSREIILAGGAQAKNIFWQVGSSATIGTTAVFKGNILAAVAITANSGANIEGRLLTQSAAVTLDANVVGFTIIP